MHPRSQVIALAQQIESELRAVLGSRSPELEVSDPPGIGLDCKIMAGIVLEEWPRRVKSRYGPEDVIQEALKVICKNWNRCTATDLQGRLRWMTAEFRGVARNERRRHTNQKMRSVRSEVGLEISDQVPDAPREMSEYELGRVRQAMERAEWSDLTGQVVEHHLFGESTLGAIAARLHLPLSTVKGKWAKARAKLQRLLGKDD